MEKINILQILNLTDPVRKDYEKAKKLFISNLQTAIKAAQSDLDYIPFNDETGIPEWYSHALGDTQPIYAIKALPNGEIRCFDYDMEPDEENLLNSEFWFNPFEDGDFADYEDLLSCLKSFVDNLKD